MKKLYKFSDFSDMEALAKHFNCIVDEATYDIYGITISGYEESYLYAVRVKKRIGFFYIKGWLVELRNLNGKTKIGFFRDKKVSARRLSYMCISNDYRYYDGYKKTNHTSQKSTHLPKEDNYDDSNMRIIINNLQQEMFLAN